MATMPTRPAIGRPTWLDARSMWASMAIAAMWLAVVFTFVIGGDVRSVDVSGSQVTIPSGVIVAVLALFGTMSVAKRGLRATVDG